jgi:hypothetical protein
MRSLSINRNTQQFAFLEHGPEAAAALDLNALARM